AVIVIAIAVAVPFVSTEQEEDPSSQIQSFDMTYEEINSELKKSLEKKNISMSSPLKITTEESISKY
ncbi:MAG: hypothetical protein GWN01_17800, partial [Nitrosopumilaceae archaeon]|nr:hypothetical protein [Nitrosopumilaceae archaeon]NIU89129.1 hypothetical protein [Nitrosopumilaceae archaeon]NIV65116.1 hypothetical protein [Nitrosopumilaceae archaeon]NIX63277.1 hypothetical protein [Nitrosopumilaceae archaeon]